MTTHDPDLEQLIRLIGQCLGRIDETAYRLQDDEPLTDYGIGDRLEDETGTLQELIDSLLVVDADSGTDADVNDVVERVLASCLDELQIPIVIRTALTAESSRVAVSRALVTGSLQRAMELAVAPLRPGDELRVSTRVERDSLLVEVEALGSDPTDAVNDRTETLREFVQELGGTCDVRSSESGRQLLLVLELPRAHVTERSDSDGFA